LVLEEREVSIGIGKVTEERRGRVSRDGGSINSDWDFSNSSSNKSGFLLRWVGVSGNSVSTFFRPEGRTFVSAFTLLPTGFSSSAGYMTVKIDADPLARKYTKQKQG
jgi:hypothetical protein